MLLLSPILSFSFLFFFFFNDTATTEIYTLSLHDALPISQDRVGTAALEAILGNAGLYVMAVAVMISTFGCNRSEEHTSELQSQSNLVCRLLLEKKKIYKLPICAECIDTVQTTSLHTLPIP